MRNSTNWTPSERGSKLPELSVSRHEHRRRHEENFGSPIHFELWQIDTHPDEFLCVVAAQFRGRPAPVDVTCNFRDIMHSYTVDQYQFRTTGLPAIDVHHEAKFGPRPGPSKRRAIG